MLGLYRGLDFGTRALLSPDNPLAYTRSSSLLSHREDRRCYKPNMIKRNTLRATTPLVSDKVAKTIVARNALYEKELSDVYKTVDQEKNYCEAVFQKSKKDVIRSLDLKDSGNNTKKIFAWLEKDSFGSVFDTETRSRSSSLPSGLSSGWSRLHLKRTSSVPNKKHSGGEKDGVSTQDVQRPQLSPTMRTRLAIHGPDSPTEVQYPLKSALFEMEVSTDDVLESRRHVFDAQILGPSPPSSQTSENDPEIPEIFVSEMNAQPESQIPQRKTSLSKRSYSTGDLQVVLSETKKELASPSNSPLLLRRAVSSSVNSESSRESWSEDSATYDSKIKYGSLDESFLQRFNDMIVEINVPQRPKPRPRLYKEEPFYLRKKCVMRQCFQNKTDLAAKLGASQAQERKNPDGERPLAEILPPIALPPIYTQQQNSRMKPSGTESEKNKSKVNGIKRMNTKINVNDPRLTENLNDCRYLRNQTKQ